MTIIMRDISWGYNLEVKGIWKSFFVYVLLAFYVTVPYNQYLLSTYYMYDIHGQQNT